jgi:hypothetical protein
MTNVICVVEPDSENPQVVVDTMEGIRLRVPHVFAGEEGQAQFRPTTGNRAYRVYHATKRHTLCWCFMPPDHHILPKFKSLLWDAGCRDVELFDTVAAGLSRLKELSKEKWNKIETIYPDRKLTRVTRPQSSSLQYWLMEFKTSPVL